MKITAILNSNPNAHGNLRLALVTAEPDDWMPEAEPMYVVAQPGDTIREGDGMEYPVTDEGLVAAAAQYDADFKRWSDTPNWEAQARYDAEWGTDNGYAPWQLNREY